MYPATIEDTLLYYGLNSKIFSSQSILDVFVLREIISREDAERLSKNFKTNREIENFLLSSGIVSQETINKAYSILLKIPFISLANIRIPSEVLALIPEKMARKFGIIPFALEDNIIRIALSRPSDLMVGFKDGLARVLNDSNHEVELFITGNEDFNLAIRQYGKKQSNEILLSKGSSPVVFLRSEPIPDEILNKLPRDFALKNRLVIFSQNKSGNFLAATEKPDSPLIKKIADFLQKENGIKLEIFAASREDIDYALSLYDKKIVDKNSQNIISQPQASTSQDKSVSADTVASVNKKGINFSNFWASPVTDLTDDNFTIDSVLPEPEQKVSTEPSPDYSNLVGAFGSGVKPNQANINPKTDTKAIKINVGENQSAAIPSEDLIKANQKEEAVDANLDENDIGRLIAGDITDANSLSEIVTEGNIPKIVAAIINYSLNNRVSDIHIEPENKTLRIRCRVDGVLRDVTKIPLPLHPPLISRIKILAKLKIDESRIPQDGRFDVTFERREVDVRVSTLPTVHGEKAVLRILDKSQSILSLEDLGMQGSAFDLTVNTISKPHGIILSTGPTGSGKSTTLYAIINRISLPGVNIVTLEDPVEYEIPGVNQCQVKPDIGFTFASGLRSVLRQDPNVIMVGEVRDAETANMATHAALTGHLVLSTLHTNDAAGALPRLTNMGVEPFLITSSINLIIAQRLVRRICPKCREELKVPQKLYDELISELNKISPNNQAERSRIPKELRLYIGRGCSECNQGFKGRIGIFEVMQMIPDIEDLAVARKTANDIKDAAVKNGMITMKQDGIIKAFQGLTTIDEVFQAVITN